MDWHVRSHCAPLPCCRRVAWLVGILAVIFTWIAQAAPSRALCEEVTNSLVRGKQTLDQRQYDDSIDYLTRAIEGGGLLGDYALWWRAKAYEGKGSTVSALGDLAALRIGFPDSPLLKGARRKEIELTAGNDSGILLLLQEFVRDYPSEYDMKFAYAVRLKQAGKTEQARELFKEIFALPTSLSKTSLQELIPSDITPADLARRGKNLNNALLFEEAEQTFRDGLKRDAGSLQVEMLDGLGYSLFRQKRYHEASGAYKAANSVYGLSRSLLRAGDMAAFEDVLPMLSRSTDERVASVLIDYGTRKRRGGDLDQALETYRQVIAEYPRAKEDALWATGWAHYLSGDCEKARLVFLQLIEEFRDSRYQYWQARCAEASHSAKTKQTVSQSVAGARNFYAYLSLLKENRNPLPVNESGAQTRASAFPTPRVDLLVSLGFTREATQELVHLSKRKSETEDLVAISASLKRLGDYRTAVAIISKIPYRENLHDLFYPMAYWTEVQAAAKENSIDPFLILAVMREESRFAADVRSWAGALGLMQLMPRTARTVLNGTNLKYRKQDDLLDPRTNIQIGSRYLKGLLATYKSLPLALAAYNAGEHNVKSWTQKGRYHYVDEFIEDIPFAETRNYVKRVMTTYIEYIRGHEGGDLKRVRQQLGELKY